MPLLPVLTIMLPLLGAGGTLGLSLLPRARPYTRYIALTAAGMTTILILTFRWVESVVVIPSLWQPSLLFGAPLALHSDALVQPLALVLALMTCGAILVDLSHTSEPRPQLVAAVQALLAAGLVALWAANLLTMIICWAIYDLLQAAGYSAAGFPARTAVRSLIFGGLATLLLWSGALLYGGGAGSELWSLMTVSDAQLMLWAVAGVLRLWAYPFHLVAPDGLDTAPFLATPLLLGPVVGWGLWFRIVLVNHGSMPGGRWMAILAALNLVIGGFLAWACGSVRRTLSWIGMGAVGAILLAAGLAGEHGTAVVVTGGVTWVLAVGVISLSDGLQQEAPWWSVPALVGALSLLGAPLTLGFVAEATLLGGLTQGGHLAWRGAFFFGNLLLVSSLVRWLLTLPSSPVPVHRWPVVARGIGLGLLMLLLVAVGLYPPLLIGGVRVPTLGSLFVMPGLMGWSLWVLSLAGGGVLAWQEGVIRPKIELLLSAIHDLLRLKWLYDAVIGALDRGLSVLRAADEVVGGRGALLWSWLLFLLFLLVWGSQ